MNLVQHNYAMAKLLAGETFEAIGDDHDNDAKWDAYDDALACLREAEDQLIAWAREVALSMAAKKDHATLIRLFDAAANDRNSKARDKVIELSARLG